MRGPMIGIGISIYGTIKAGLGVSTKFLLTNVLNLIATIGPNAVAGGTSGTWIEVFDETLGKVLELFPAGTATSPGQRGSYDTDEGATLGSEEVINGDFSNGLTGWTLNAAATGKATVVDETLSYSTPHDDHAEVKQLNQSVVGQTYDISFDVVSTGTDAVVTIQYGRDSIYANLLSLLAVGTHTYQAVSTHTDGFSISVRTDGEIAIDNVSAKIVTPTFLNSVSKADSTKLHPTKQLTENGVTSTVFLVHQAWPGAAQAVDANSYAVGKNGNHWYYFQADSGGGTTGGSEPTWPNTLDATVVDNDITWTNKGRYSNMGPGYLPRILNEPASENEALHTRDMTDVVWAKTTMTAAKDQTGYDGSANGASSLLATAANATCLQAVTLGAADYVMSADIKRLVGTGTVEVTVDGGTTWVDITANLSTAGWYRAEATKNAANPSIGFRIVTDTDKIAVDFSGVEAGTVASSRIPTTTGSVQRNATSFLVTPDTEEYLRIRFADINPQIYLSSGTIEVSSDGTTLTVTDGTNVMDHIVAMEIGDQITIVESTGQLFYNWSQVDVNASYSPTWGEIALGNAVDYTFSADLDPTDQTWSQP